jgi:hypothetical protein
VSFGPYLLVERIGLGARSEVHRAKRHTDRGDEWFAVKRALAGAVHDLETQSALFAEAELLSKLDHPGIVRVRDFGSMQGVAFVAYDLVDGVDLERLLTLSKERDRPLPLAASLTIALRVARPSSTCTALAGAASRSSIATSGPPTSSSRATVRCGSPTSASRRCLGETRRRGGRDQGDGAVHEPRASSRRGSRSAQRPLRPRGGGARDDERQAAVRRPASGRRPPGPRRGPPARPRPTRALAPGAAAGVLAQGARPRACGKIRYEHKSSRCPTWARARFGRAGGRRRRRARCW